MDNKALISQIQTWARELGFSQIGVTGVDLSSAEPGLLSWLANGFHGDMAYMAAHGLKRARPAELVPGTVSVLTARMDYLPRFTSHATHAATDAASDGDWTELELQRLQHANEAIVSIYARGRDYHKVMRSRLQKLSERIALHIKPLGYRVFTDSAPVLEAELAQRSGQGWRGKHTLVLNREAGSMFFLGRNLFEYKFATYARNLIALWQLQSMHQRLSDTGHRCSLQAGCASLHFLFNHRARWQHSIGVSPLDRQSRLRL